MVAKDTWQKVCSGAFAAACFVAAKFLVWKRERDEKDELPARFVSLLAIDLAPDGFYVETRGLRIREETIAGQFIRMTTRPMSCVLARFVNDPKVPTPDSIARDITGTIEFFSSDGRRLFFLDSRWGDTDQPRPGQTTIPLLSVDFKVGQTREVDIAMKLPEDEDCHGINNDSYARWRLTGTDFWAIVRLRGPYVDKRWRFGFGNPGPGQSLETRGFLEL